MTLVAAFSNSMSAVMVADSRLTWQEQRDRSRRKYRDVAQKVAHLGGEGLVGFAGDVATAVKVVRGISGMYRLRGTSWLKSPKHVKQLLRLLNVRPTDPKASFIVTFVDRGHLVMSRPQIPGAVVIEFSSDGHYHQRTYMGFSIIGSGSTLKADIQKDPGLGPFLKLSNPPDDPEAMARCAIFFAHVFFEKIAAAHLPDVGGLFQLYLQMPNTVYAVPYERWVDVDNKVGTWVSMEIDPDGRWLQVHGPTGLRIPLGFPYQDDSTLKDGHLNLTFDIREKLTASSVGMLPRTNPQMIYQPPEGQFHLHGPTVRRNSSLPLNGTLQPTVSMGQHKPSVAQFEHQAVIDS